MKDICTSAIVEDQQRSPLITMTDDESNASNKVEDAQNGNLASQGPMNDPTKTPVDDKCCCGFLHIRIAAIIIAVVELIFIIYQMVTTTILYDKIDDEYAFAFTLTLFSFILAFVAVVLMVEGVRRQSPYFLVPHLLMQCAVIVATFLLCGYLFLLWIGGTSIDIDAILYEDSPRGEFGVTQASRYPTIEVNVLARFLNTALIAILVLTVIALSVQIWFFTVIRRCYQYLYRISEKSAVVPDNKVRI